METLMSFRRVSSCGALGMSSISPNLGSISSTTTNFRGIASSRSIPRRSACSPLDWRRSEILASAKFAMSKLSLLLCSERPVVKAAVGADNVVTEPVTSIKFTTTLRVPDSSRELTVLGAGVREKQIAFLKVKVYAVALYAEAGIRTPLASWKGKKPAELANDDGMFKALAEAPVEKALQIVLARDVDGATFWGALDEALVPRLKAASAGADGDAALAAFGKVFQGRSLKQGTAIILTWAQPSSLKIAVGAGGLSPPSTEATIDSKVLVAALFDVFLGPTAVSPSAKDAVANGIAKLT